MKLAWVLAVVIAVATVLWLTMKDQLADGIEPTTESGAIMAGNARHGPAGTEAPAGARLTDHTGHSPEPPTADQAAQTAMCDKELMAAIGALNRYDQERFSSISIRPSGMEPYRGLGVGQLEQLAAQGDAMAMVVLAIAELVSATGMRDVDTVGLIRGDIDPETQGIDPGALLDDKPDLTRTAADWLYEAAIHGRLEAFREMGGPLSASRLTPVDLGWLTQDAYDALTDEERRLVRVDKVYESAYYLLDPELVESGHMPYELWRQELLEDWGPLLDEIVVPIADGFKTDLERRGRALPAIEPRMTINEYLSNNGSNCEF